MDLIAVRKTVRSLPDEVARQKETIIKSMKVILENNLDGGS